MPGLRAARSPGWLLEAGYTGNQGKHIYVNTSINDAIPALPTDNSSIQSRRIATPLLGNLPFYAPQGSSNYNALTVNLERRFSGGFSVLTNYTYSRALGNTDAAAKSPCDSWKFRSRLAALLIRNRRANLFRIRLLCCMI